MLQTLVCGQAILRAVAPMAELAHIQRVRLFVLVLKVAFQGVVAREGTVTVGTLLRLIDAAAGRWGHPQLALLFIFAVHV